MVHLLCFLYFVSCSDFVCLQETDEKLFHTTGEREWSLVTGALGCRGCKAVIINPTIFFNSVWFLFYALDVSPSSSLFMRTGETMQSLMTWIYFACDGPHFYAYIRLVQNTPFKVNYLHRDCLKKVFQCSITSVTKFYFSGFIWTSNHRAFLLLLSYLPVFQMNKGWERETTLPVCIQKIFLINIANGIFWIIHYCPYYYTSFSTC